VTELSLFSRFLFFFKFYFDYKNKTMPYQSAFTLIIIAGAFTATGGVLALGNWLETGKWKRPIQEDYWAHFLAARDKRLKNEAAKK
jgi:hypothetical protein